MTGTSIEPQTLLDENRITALPTRYLRAIDREDIATLRVSYQPGATEEYGGMYSGSARGYVATVGLRAMARCERLIDTDRMAIESRAKYALDPVRREASAPRIFHSGTLSTGK